VSTNPQSRSSARSSKQEASRTPRKGAVTKPNNKLTVDRKALKKLNLVAVAYSFVEREAFPTEEAYVAELEVETRAQEVIDLLNKLKIPAKGYPGDQYFLTNLLVDQPDLVVNLVDSLRGRDSLQTSVPAALELTEIPYTGAGMRGLVIGNDRNLFKQLLIASDIPTPAYQFISRSNTKVDAELGLPLIVKLNESGGSVGIDNEAVKESLEEAQEKVNELISTYKVPVIVERFIPGPEVTVIVFEDGRRKHTFMGEKNFRKKTDGKYYFTSLESYDDPHAYTYRKLNDKQMEDKIERLAERAFTILHNRDYSKFDVRIDKESGTPYFTDCNPNTAFGPNKGLPFTEVLDLHGIKFESVLTSLISKHAKKLP
jgi:D-alanine-D-alanine ligase